jgi:hypothetical protein
MRLLTARKPRRSPEIVPTMPTVNLLSQSEFDRLAARRLRGRFAAGAAMLVVAIGAATGAQHIRVNQTEKLVAVEQAQTDRLTAQTQQLAPVRAFVNGVALQKATVDKAMADEVFTSQVLAGIRDATPPGAQLSTVTITVTPPADPSDPAAAPADTTSACPGPDPYNTRVVVGCVQLSGTAADRSEVGDMVIALGDSGLFVEPFISTTTTGDTDGVTFSGSVGLSEKVYSGRYAEEDGQ